MDNRKLFLIAGIPASGKTTYGLHLAKALGIPFFSKDAFKEHMHDALRYDPVSPEISRLYGAAAYEVFYYAAGQVMRAGSPLILESNFPPQSAKILDSMLLDYGYEALTFLFDGQLEALHRRFVERDHSPQRHAGLVAKSGIYEDYATFAKAVEPLRGFQTRGEQIRVDTTQFEQVRYEELDRIAAEFLNQK